MWPTPSPRPPGAGSPDPAAVPRAAVTIAGCRFPGVPAWPSRTHAPQTHALESWDPFAPAARAIDGTAKIRSEEHTSELQSRENLVCRLLLEKKNIHAIL